MIQTDVAVIGAGPAGLMAAETIARGGKRVTVFDAMPSAGRKFLMAGRGGLNLTHSEPLNQFLRRYGDTPPHLAAAIDSFPPQMLRDWSAALGQETFIGSSGRVFPKAFKASPLLRAWLRRLAASGVQFNLHHRWIGWDDDGALTFDTPNGARYADARATILALGGASWPRLGSDGAWTSLLQARGITIAPLRPANCGFGVAWSALFRERFAGHPLKNVALSFGKNTVRGEMMLTQYGVEGGVIYALSSVLRDTILEKGEVVPTISLRPDLPFDQLMSKLQTPRARHSLSTYLRKTLHLSPVAVALLHEAAIASRTPLASLSQDRLAALIDAVPVRLTSVAPIARAISTTGGIAFDQLDDNYMLRNAPGVFAAGEMLDWEAPTGGYLLQACFATGKGAGEGVLKFLRRVG